MPLCKHLSTTLVQMSSQGFRSKPTYLNQERSKKPLLLLSAPEAGHSNRTAPLRELNKPGCGPGTEGLLALASTILGWISITAKPKGVGGGGVTEVGREGEVGRELSQLSARIKSSRSRVQNRSTPVKKVRCVEHITPVLGL